MTTEERTQAFAEFKRCLKDDGIMVITMDYPSVELEAFRASIEGLNLKFKYGHDFAIPADCLDSTIYPGLKCFRSIISK